MSSPFLGDILLRKTSTSMSSTRARSNGFISNLPDCKFAATNPKIRQFFCNEAPKKISVLIGIFRFLTDYKNFYPKEKKEVPKRNDKKHEYKEFRRLAWSLDGSFLHVLRVEVDLYSIRLVAFYNVFVDIQERDYGSMHADWNILPPIEIKDVNG
ncbi:hypothetical protein JHK86_034050 [Glycine max]|nr:hypothetical protein JHK86_034050 [Glycine max]